MQRHRRRALLRMLGAAGALAGMQHVSAATAAPPALRLEPDRAGRLKLVLDVAVLGHTDAPNFAGRIGDPNSHDFFNTDVRGDSYYVEGYIYPGGTIPKATQPTRLGPFREAPARRNNQVTWEFKSAQPIGHWLNRGWVLINGRREPYRDINGAPVEHARTEPHLLSEHTFVLGRFGDGRLSHETLVTSGVENGNDPDAEVVVRAVTGGTGRFAHVSGEVTQTRLGRNTTPLRSFEKVGEVLSPNYRFEFDLRLR